MTKALSKILTLALFTGIFLTSCDETGLGERPVEFDLILKSETKWEANVETNAKIRRVSYKEYDRYGNLIIYRQFNHAGDLREDTRVFFEEDNRREEITTYNENGEVVDDVISIIESDNFSSTRTTYSPEGNIIAREIISYDENGNIIKTVNYGENGEIINVVKYDYNYNADGELIKVVTLPENGSIVYEDSLVYNPSERNIERLRFDPESGELIRVQTIKYNSNGRIINEFVRIPEKNSTVKYIYEYTYF